MVFEVLGYIGTILTIVAYVPQMRHIVTEHCSGGVSMRSWLIWLVATVSLLIYAATSKDLVFITLEAVSLVAIVIILIMIRLYGKRVCHSTEKEFKKKKK